MRGVVLAGGVGSRLGYLGGLLPKSMVPVQGHPLLWYALRSLAAMDASEVTVAALAPSETVVRYLRRLSPSELGISRLKVHLLRAPTTSPVATLREAVGGYSGEIGVALGDGFVIARNLSDFPRELHRRGAAVGQTVAWENDRRVLRRTCEVRLARDGRMLSIREKPSSPTPGYRGCGTYLFGEGELRSLYRDAIERGPVTSMTDLIGAGVRRKSAIGFRLKGWDINVNTVGDLISAWGRVPSSLSEAL
ncbi:MAG: NDP-sugar synthase [Euryarchaeota archaeon]|nr:NDP-sugar synthase [Euryarchaeota archaeon]MDE1836407.1 NDP-sugar synthase [Euryarchaeota archaeon]MDE1879078.1 NDP-sugar synthase [Euryarchaeota archaeon]MDE2044155.1 NDP-sugar synthase [Thermoplasmata archaeon]